MSLYTIAKAHSLPPNATIDLEELINSIQTEKAAELQAVHLDYQAQLAALNTELSEGKRVFGEYKAAAQQAITAAQAAIKDASLDDAATIATISEVVAGLTASDKEKRQAEILSQIEALKLELAK